MGKINLLILFLSLLQLQTCFGDHVGQLSTLHKVVLDGYDKGAKPDGQIKVKFGMEILRVSLCPHKEVLDTQVWLRLSWTDNRLTWNSSQFGGIESLKVNPNLLWIPDLTFWNLVGVVKIDPSNVIVYPNGKLLHVPRAYIKTACDVNYQNWPWGDQNCTFIAGSWTHDMESMDIQPYVSSSNPDNVGKLSFKHLTNANQVQIIGNQFVREEKMYECHECKNEVYPNLQMSFQFKMTQKYKTNEGLMKNPRVSIRNRGVITFSEENEKPQQLVAFAKSPTFYANLAILALCSLLAVEM